MSMTARAGADLTKSGWEKSDFPIICGNCIGENPYVRMIREQFGEECKICSRPYTVFRWKPGTRSRFRKTEICQCCSKIKNVCQTCLLDLEFGIPIQVRDGQITSEQDIPLSEVNREYFADQAERMIEEGTTSWAKMKPSQALLKLARSEPYNIRHRPAISPAHKSESKSSDGSSVAVGSLSDDYSTQSASESATIDASQFKTVLITGLTAFINEQDLRDRLYPFGKLESVKVYKEYGTALVKYSTHEEAQSAIVQCYQALVIKGVKLTVNWSCEQLTPSLEEKKEHVTVQQSETKQVSQSQSQSLVDADPLSLLCDY